MSHDRPFFADTPRILKELLKGFLIRVGIILVFAAYFFLLVAFLFTGD